MDHQSDHPAATGEGYVGVGIGAFIAFALTLWLVVEAAREYMRRHSRAEVRAAAQQSTLVASTGAVFQGLSRARGR